MNIIARNIFETIRASYEVDVLDWEHREEYIITISEALQKSDSEFEIDGMDFRCIDANIIRAIYQTEIEHYIKDCYWTKFKDNMPPWIEIDWTKTAQNVLDSGGYGHHFGTYDDDEHYTDGYYIFRIS